MTKDFDKSAPPNIRYKKTLEIVNKYISKDEKVLDFGTINPFTEIMLHEGFQVENTKGEDLDTEYGKINDYDVDCYTSFELFEHLLAPYNVLKEIKKGKLVSSVPLNVWFAKSYWNNNDEWDQHYHEFEPRQYDLLLKKAGWKIIHRELVKKPDRLRFGIRPLLRYIYPSYYFVVAIKE
ncbi:MAG: methyltransferase [Bacteroidota bacterium]